MSDLYRMHIDQNEERMSSPPDWEEIRREARRLETSLDTDLGRLSKLCCAAGSSSLPLAQALSSQIERGLLDLADVNERLSKSSKSTVSSHTLQRHRDIMADYGREFERTRTHLKRLAVSTASESSTSFTSNSGTSDLLRREYEHVRATAERNVDQQITIAMSAHEGLLKQKQSVQALTRRIGQLTSDKLPAVAALLSKIRLKQFRDNFALIALITLLLLLTLIYLFR